MQNRTRFAAIVLFCAAASPLVAQDATGSVPGSAMPAATASVTESAPAPVTASPAAAPSLAPTVEHAALGARRTAAAPEPVTVPRRADSSRNRALMIVGGAALIIGAIIDRPAGTIIMIGGGVMGLFGLYQYLQ
jgi:hypothetical protein